MDRNKRFQNKICIITGGSSGIGKATARCWWWTGDGYRFYKCASKADEACLSLRKFIRVNI